SSTLYFSRAAYHRDLHSFPTRRSSDLEYVVNAQATRQNLDLLQAINSGRIAQFATGGLAGKGGLSTSRDRANISVGDINITTNGDRKSTRLNSSHVKISYAVFCLKKKK